MKKLLTIALAAGMFFTFAACGGSNVEVSEEMQGFMDKIENTNSITDAAEAYDYAAENIPLDLYSLEEPSVKNKEEMDGKAVYTMNVKHGMIESDVQICWKEGKLVNIKEVPAE